MQISNTRFWVQACEHGNVVIVAGDIDLVTAPRFGESIAQFSNGDVIVDLTAVEFMDSSGLKILLAAHRMLQRRGSRLVIRGASPIVRRVMQITHLDELLSFDAA